MKPHALFARFTTGCLFSTATLAAAPLFFALSSVAGLLTLSPQSGVVHSVVNISGANFDSNPSNNIVLFGAVRSVVTAASPTSLTVLVPTGATFAPVTVTSGGFTAQSNQRFLPTFAGTGSAISEASFSGQHTLSTENGPYQLLIADLDGDGKPDLILANVYAHSVSLLRNIGTVGALDSGSFAPAVDLPLALGSSNDNPIGIEAADVDGDGKIDLLVCDRGGNQLLIFRNVAAPGTLTTNSFAAPVALQTGIDPRRVRVADLDGDGRPDLVVTCYADGALALFQNIGSPGMLTTNSFAPMVTLPAGSGCYDVAIADFDGDGQLDLAVVNYNALYLSLFRNISSPGPLDTNSFEAEVQIPAVASGESILAVDVDGDGLLDLVLGSIQGDTMSVHRNLSSPGSLAFDTHVDFGAPGWVHNVAAADFTGDGKPDIAIDGELNSYMAIFQNGSAPGGFSISSLSNRVDFASGYNAWGIAVGDLDGDGRPDVAFCNSYDNTLTLYRNVSPQANAPDHFDWSPISSPHFTTAGFPVTLMARNATNGIVTNFSGTVFLTSTNGMAVNPPVSGNFAQGSWTGLVRVPQVGTNVVLRAVDASGAMGLSNPFNVLQPPGLVSIPVGNNLLLFWSTNSTGFLLETSARLSPAQWTSVGPPTQIGDQFLQAVPTTGRSGYYRLRYTGP